MDFKGLKNAKPSEGGNYLTPGEYDIEITKAFFKKTRAKGDAFIVDFKVTKAQELLAEGQAPKTPEGSERNWYQGLSDTDIAWPEIKRFVYSILSATTSEKQVEIDDKIEAMMTAIENGKTDLFNGKKAHASVSHKTTKLNKKEIDAIKWSPLL